MAKITREAQKRKETRIGNRGGGGKKQNHHVPVPYSSNPIPPPSSVFPSFSSYSSSSSSFPHFMLGYLLFRTRVLIRRALITAFCHVHAIGPFYRNCRLPRVEGTRGWERRRGEGCATPHSLNQITARNRVIVKIIICFYRSS